MFQHIYGFCSNPLVLWPTDIGETDDQTKLRKHLNCSVQWDWKIHIMSFLFLLLLNKLHSTSGIMCRFVLKEDIRKFSPNFPLDCEGKHDYRGRKVKLICINTNISMKICIDHSTHNTCIDLTQNIKLYHWFQRFLKKCITEKLQKTNHFAIYISDLWYLLLPNKTAFRTCQSYLAQPVYWRWVSTESSVLRRKPANQDISENPKLHATPVPLTMV